MRHDARNTGRTTLTGKYPGGKPWAFKTGKGIFSTPVIGSDGTVYVGSADSSFYAIKPNGKRRWRFRTGNIIRLGRRPARQHRHVRLRRRDPLLYAEALCATVPNYGPVLAVATRLCNRQGKLVASGTYVTRPYAARGSASARPRGVSVSKLELARPSADSDGSATATLKLAHGARYPARSHAAHIVLTDAASGAVVPITYRKDTSVTKDAHGNIAQVKLTIPAGTTMPASVRAYVISDVYPLLIRILS